MALSAVSCTTMSKEEKARLEQAVVDARSAAEMAAMSAEKAAEAAKAAADKAEYASKKADRVFKQSLKK